MAASRGKKLTLPIACVARWPERAEIHARHRNVVTVVVTRDGVLTWLEEVVTAAAAAAALKL